MPALLTAPSAKILFEVSLKYLTYSGEEKRHTGVIEADDCFEATDIVFRNIADARNLVGVETRILPHKE